MKTRVVKLQGWLLLAAFLSFDAGAATYYVNVSNTAPDSPFATWSTAATNIQDAIDIAGAGDLILVTNGIYDTGGRVIYGSLTNRVAITKAVTVQSANGPQDTVIQGNPTLDNTAVRCVYMSDGSFLCGFTLAAR